MGKKDKNKVKVKGAEKTATKTDKKLVLKQKKMLAKLGETDIEQIIMQFEEDEKKRVETVEIICPAPSPRVNSAICAHSEKEEIYIHGGEFNDGQKIVIYNDMYVYNVPKNEWKQIKSPAGPTPRSGHSMASVATDGGQLWLFGGEYASPSQLQFYHYKDLWVFRQNGKKWEKINAQNGPSPRSGHRMVVSKKQLIVFGGFYDNTQSYKYFNDLHLFSLENYTWSTIIPVGAIHPVPRSGCCMAASNDGKILVWGGYSKAPIKKKFDRGVTHADMFSLAQDLKSDPKGSKWQWTQLKPGGMRPPPRGGVSLATAPNGKGYVFGGVLDTIEDEEELQGQFSNDLHSIDLSNPVWRLIEVTGKKATKKKAKGDVEMEETESETKTVTTDGVFTMVVGGSKSSNSAGSKSESTITNGPSPRMNSGLVVCKSNLYLFGGMFEEGSKQFTLGDVYSLDLHKLDSWKTIIPNTITAKDWLGSDSEDSDSLSDSSGLECNTDSSDSDESDSDSSEMDTN